MLFLEMPMPHIIVPSLQVPSLTHLFDPEYVRDPLESEQVTGAIILISSTALLGVVFLYPLHSCELCVLCPPPSHRDGVPPLGSSLWKSFQGVLADFGWVLGGPPRLPGSGMV